MWILSVKDIIDVLCVLGEFFTQMHHILPTTKIEHQSLTIVHSASDGRHASSFSCSPFGRRVTFLWFRSIPTCFSFYRELYIFLGFSTCACWMREKQKPVCMQYTQSVKSHTKIDPSVLSRIADIVNTLVRTCLLNMIRIKRFLSFWPLRNWNKM